MHTIQSAPPESSEARPREAAAVADCDVGSDGRQEVSSGPATPIHRDANAVWVLVGIIGFFCVWGYATYLGSGGSVLPVFLDIPSAILVVLTPVTVLLAVYGWAGTADAVAWIFRKPAPCSAADDAVTFFQFGAAFALAGGFMATMIGLILMLASMDDVSSLGHGMALALLSQLYGVFIAVICVALAAHVARRHPSEAAGEPLAPRAAGVAGITTIAGTLTAIIAFGIMLLSLAPNL